MQSPLKYFIVFFLLLGWLVSGCGTNKQAPKPEELIVKSWKLHKLNAGPEPIPPQIMVNSSFNFAKDGRYEILLGTLEKGVWRLNEDKTVLITTPDGASVEQHIDIEVLSPDQLVIVNRQAANPIRMELVPDV